MQISILNLVLQQLENPEAGSEQLGHVSLLFSCDFMKSKYRSDISNEKLASKVKCAVNIN